MSTSTTFSYTIIRNKYYTLYNARDCNLSVFTTLWIIFRIFVKYNHNLARILIIYIFQSLSYNLSYWIKDFRFLQDSICHIIISLKRLCHFFIVYEYDFRSFLLYKVYMMLSLFFVRNVIFDRLSVSHSFSSFVIELNMCLTSEIQIDICIELDCCD